MIKSDKIIYYIENFYGYGNWDSPYYYIGMEEGGGSDFNLVNEKIENYYYNGVDRGNDFFTKEQLLDNYGFQIFMMPSILRVMEFFRINQPPIIQNTWRPSIKIQMELNNLIVDNDSMRDFQRLHWGSHQTNYKHALIELFPLPSPKLNEWNYKNWVENADNLSLNTRENYRNNYARIRINNICKKIRENKPKLVVFYGNTYVTYYSQIIQCIDTNLNLENLPINSPNNIGTVKISIKEWGESKTIFLICSHPVTTGITNDFWNNLITEIKRLIQ